MTRGLSSLLTGLILLWLVAIMEKPAASQGKTTKAPASYENTVRPFLVRNCQTCHNAKVSSGGLNLERHQNESALMASRDEWEKVIHKLETGDMPPKGMPRPDPAESGAVIQLIRERFEAADKASPPNAGTVTARRLNRNEYNNTVRDLTGVDLRLAKDFPEDDTGYGFDNIGDVLSLSPVLMEKYLAAAERIARMAIFGPGNGEPSVIRHQPTLRRRLEKAGPPVTLPAPYTVTKYDETGLSQPSSLHFRHHFPVDGEYAFRMTTYRNRPRGSDPVQMAVWIDGKIVAAHELADPEPEGETREVRARVAAGEHWGAVTLLRQFEGLPASYGGLNPAKGAAPPPPDPARFLQPPPPNATPEQLEQFERRKAGAATRTRQQEPAEALVLNWVEVVGPYEFDKGPSIESRRKIYACGHFDGKHQPQCARLNVSSLARRAFRRPVTPLEVNELAGLVLAAQKRGRSFEQGLSLALQALLVSPDFLFRIEKDPPAPSAGRSSPVSQPELATRLAYFLWSSMPDDELLRLAEQQTLRNPEVLAAQVRRMLHDPKSRALVENFGGQWLQFRSLDGVTPDRDLFPDFEDYLRYSMKEETVQLFEHILRQDRGILDFVDANYTFLNERLARHYGIHGIKGPEFRKVDLSGTNRRGVLTHAGVLTVSSYANRTSPVLRGKWILENLLNAPPPPPPPNVPTIDESAVGTTATLREQMEKHRSNAVCASCHARMDPMGFALENFDAVGAWRTRDGKLPIDPSGSLPDGRTFRGPDEFHGLLAAGRASFAECLTEKMLTYALGRGLERYDRAAIRAITTNLAANDYRFSRLVLEIVNSLPFQMRMPHGERKL